MTKPILTAKEVASLLSVSYFLILDEAKRGKIPFFRVGNRILFREESILSWIETQEKASIRSLAESPSHGKIRRIDP